MWKEMSHFSEERVAKSREVGLTKSGPINPKALVRVSISVFGILWRVGLAKRARQHALEVFPSMS